MCHFVRAVCDLICQLSLALIYLYNSFACSALTLLVRRQKELLVPVCKKLSDEVLAWLCLK